MNGLTACAKDVLSEVGLDFFVLLVFMLIVVLCVEYG